MMNSAGANLGGGGWWFRRRWHPQAGGRGFAGPVHAYFVQDLGTRHKVGRGAFGQTRNVEEYVLPAVVRPYEAESLVLEVLHNGSGLLSRRPGSGIRARRGLSRG